MANIVPAAVSSQLDNTGEERIHIANTVPGGVVRSPWVAPPSPFESVFMSWAGSTLLPYGTDAGQTTFTTVDAGGIVSVSETRVFHTNNRLFTTRSSGRTRVSDDGLIWSGVTGLSQSGAIQTLLHNGTQYIGFTESGTTCWVSADGNTWSSQALGFTIVSGRVAQKGSSIVAFASTNNAIRLSTDNGATYSSVSMGGSVTNFSKSFPLATANRFLVFGVNTSSPFQSVVKWSTTGAAGTWTEVNLPIGGLSGPNLYQACVNTDTGRIVAVYSTGDVYYSDDEGSTWSAGTSLLQNTFYSATTEMMKYSSLNGRVYYLGFYSDGGAIDDYRLYSSPDGVTAWTLHFSQNSADGGLNNLALWELA